MIFHKQSTLHNCGQIAVASLTDNPVDKVEAIVGHRHGTRTHELIKALAALGWQAAGQRCRPLHRMELPDYALLQVRFMRNNLPQRGWHWVALAHRQVYDGCMESPMLFGIYRRTIADYPYCDGRIAAYLPLQPQATAEQTRQK
jgi:hypothetical protein